MKRGMHQGQLGMFLPAAKFNEVLRGDDQQDASQHMLKSNAAHPKEEGGQGKIADVEGQFLPCPLLFDGH